MATVKVNIGCGTHVVPGWINYDKSLNIVLSRYKFLKKLLYTFRLIPRIFYETTWPSNIIRRDVRKGLPLLNESVDFVYCSHFIEHLTREEAIKVLRECCRVLKHGGWIRISCPDLRILAIKYLEGDANFILFQTSRKDELSHAFVKSLRMLDERPFYQKIISPCFPHRCSYDFDSLKSLLIASGFNLVEKRLFREGVTPDIDKLDNRPLESLYVEAQKL